MLIWMDMMTESATRVEVGLEERLLRLAGGDAPCCRPQYVEVAAEIRASPKFPAALRRARALADASRLTAVALLRRRGELCACEVQAALGLHHATVSHHMRVLVDAGLVSERRVGKWRYYRRNGREEVVLP
jgi:hypothetical protein